uniref:Uncharacterized protein n=1 Tax=Callithrix jacchus TaxID=9483 RepID=A0A8I4A3S6_CALJA
MFLSSSFSACWAFLPKVHIQIAGILISEKAELQTALAHRQRASRQKEGESEDLASSLQYSWQDAGELEWALFAFTTWQKKADRVIPTTCPIPWQPAFSDGGASLKFPSAGWSVLPEGSMGHFLLLVCVFVRGSLTNTTVFESAAVGKLGVLWGTSTGRRALRPSAWPALTWLWPLPSPR